MNKIEKKMILILKELRDDYGVFEIKAEFESEGSRMEEMMRLKDITSYVNLPIILKIGGVEAVTDVYNGLAIGIKGCIAPMAETKYALSKFTDLIDNYVAKDNAEDIDFVNNEIDYKNLLNKIYSIKKGRHYFNPLASIINE